MNEKVIVGIVAFFSGAAIGGAAGFFISKAIANRKFNDALDRELEPYLKKAGKVKVEPAEEKKEPEEDKAPKSFENVDKEAVVADIGNVEKKKADLKNKKGKMQKEYNRYATSYSGTEHKDVVDPEEEFANEEEDPLKIYEIPEEAFMDEDDPRYREDYDHVYVVYYSEDDTYAFEANDRKIEDPHDFFGDVYIDLEGDHYGVFTLRNNPKASDYYITLNAGSYAEEICGCYPEPEDED